MNPDMKRHLELEIKTLQNVPRDEDKLERLLKVKVKLPKNPADYALNNPNKKFEILLGAKAGDVIKTDDKRKDRVSISLKN